MSYSESPVRVIYIRAIGRQGGPELTPNLGNLGRWGGAHKWLTTLEGSCGQELELAHPPRNNQRKKTQKCSHVSALTIHKWEPAWSQQESGPGGRKRLQQQKPYVEFRHPRAHGQRLKHPLTLICNPSSSQDKVRWEIPSNGNPRNEP